MFHTRPNNPAPKRDPRSVEIPAKELEFSFACSGGPGGQNVNKTATKAVLKWDYMKSEALTFEQKGMITRDHLLSNRINGEGVIVIHEQSTRSQDSNKELAIKKLHDLVKNAITPQAERKETRAPRWAKEERIANKRANAHRKQGRSGKWEE